MTPYENLQQPKEKEDIWINLVRSLGEGHVLTRVLGSHWTCESSMEALWESEELDNEIRNAAKKEDTKRLLVLSDEDVTRQTLIWLLEKV